MYATCTDHGSAVTSVTVRTLHRTRAAAEAAISTEVRALRRQPGQSTSWVDRVVVEVPAGTRKGALVRRV